MTASAPTPRERAPQEHAAVFGHGAGSLAATAVAVFGAARESGEALLFMTDEPSVDLLADLPGRDALLASGRLRLIRTSDAYPHRDPERLLAAFDATLRDVLADGWTGMRVVADNTSLVRGSDGSFADWVRWEHVTHRWQAGNPVVGTCWFDLDVVDSERRVALTSIHPEVRGNGGAPSFRLLAQDAGLRLVGDVDAGQVGALGRVLAQAPYRGVLVVDVSGVGYLHHTAFAALEMLPAAIDRVRLVGARDVHRRVWEVVADPAGRVELA